MSSSVKSKIAIVLLIVGLIGTIVSYGESVQWIGRYFPGFCLNRDGSIFSVVHPRWPGAIAGLKIGDKLLSYNGISFNGTEEFFRYLNTAPLKESVFYEFKRGSQSFSHTLPVRQFSFDDFLLAFLNPLIVGVVFLITGALVFFLRPQGYGNFPFLLAVSSTGFINIFAVDAYTGQSLLIPFYLILILFSVSMPHGHATVHGELPFNKRHPRLWGWIYGICFSVGLLLYGLAIFAGIPISTVIRYAFYTALISYWAAHVLSLLIFLTTRSPAVKQRFWALFYAFLSGFPPFFYYFCREMFNIVLPPELLFLYVLFSFFVFLAILRLNAMEINLSISKNTLYGVGGLLFALAVAFDFVFVPAIFRQYAFDGRFLLPVIFMLVLIKSAWVLWANYQRWGDLHFFYSSYKFKDLLQKTADQITRQITHEGILNNLVAGLRQHLKIETITCYLSLKETEDFIRMDLAGWENHPDLPKRLYRGEMNFAGRPFVAKKEAGSEGNSDGLGNFLKEYGFELLIPFRFNRQVIGFLALGPKLHFFPYTPEDVGNLQTLMAPCAVGLINATQRDELLKVQEKLKAENSILRERVQTTPSVIIGETGGLKEIFHKISLMQHSQSSILLRGETGSGKEVIAQAIHARSERTNTPFVAVNCTAIPETLIESELFGSEKGAFTGAIARRIGFFEAASGGTIFLDEIGDISFGMQAKLLRVLQEKEIKRVGGQEVIPVDVRVIAATNKDLEEAIRKKKFREDLYYRLNVITFFIPPLRDRKEDLEELIAHFLKEFASEMKKEVRYPDNATLKRLRSYAWPGNVRELQNVIERAIALCPNGERLQITDLEGSLWRSDDSGVLSDAKDYYQKIEEFQKRTIIYALEKAEHNKAQAARDLGIHVTHLHRIIRKLGL